MAGSKNKTVATSDDVADYLGGLEDERRHDTQLLTDLMRQVTGQPPVMWGSSIIGFGTRHYRYESGREGDIAAVSFAARKDQFVLYLTGALSGYEDLLQRLGSHRTGKGCLYVKRLEDVDELALRALVDRSYRAAAG